MKQGRTIEELEMEIQRQKSAAKDYLRSTTDISMGLNESRRAELVIAGDGRNPEAHLSIGTVAHEHIADKVDIPRKYYDRMAAQNPALLAVNVNTWLHSGTPDVKMVRSLDGRARAVLSNRYHRIDNAAIAEAALPILREMRDLQVLSCEITERRMYLQVVSPRIQGEVKVGDVVQMGIVISNSEVGCGSVRIEPLIYRLVCMNGMIRPHAMKRHHVGRRVDLGFLVEEDASIYRDETLRIEDRSIMMRVEDTLRYAFNEASFHKELLKLRDAAAIPIETADVEQAVKELTKKFLLTKDEGLHAMKNLVNGLDLSKFGLANAVTSLANREEVSYDRAVDLERIGGQIIDLSPSEWKPISRAGM